MSLSPCQGKGAGHLRYRSKDWALSPPTAASGSRRTSAVSPTLVTRCSLRSPSSFQTQEGAGQVVFFFLCFLTHFFPHSFPQLPQMFTEGLVGSKRFAWWHAL